METLYDKYKNIQLCLEKYRKYQIEEKFYDYNEFKKNMQIDQYIKHLCFDKKKEKNVYVYMFKHDSKHIQTTAQFKRILDKLPIEQSIVLIITKVPLNVYINKALLKYKHLSVYNYLHKFFDTELSKGPLCSPHTLLTTSEVRILCSRDLILHPLSLPSISVNDPQNIWIGGDIGQVIKIQSVSEITGKTERYRIISPDSGKILNKQLVVVQKQPTAKKPDVNNDNNEDADDISEYIDKVDDDDDDDDDETNY